MKSQFPEDVDFYRYRRHRGVNLGSWFVLERWITDNPFHGAQSPAQSDLDVATGIDAKSILEHHWDNWVTEQDWRWLAEQGINSVRIPIGYYHLCGADPVVLHGTDFANLYDTFVGAWNRITGALATAEQYGIGVLFDLHAAPGKQNSDAHSGTSMDPLFFHSKKNMAHTINVLSTFVTHITAFVQSHDPPLPNLIGIELLNEPAPGSHDESLKKWYSDAIHAIRQIDPSLPIYISDSWQTDQYAAFIRQTNTPFVALDHHLYRCFTSSDISTPASEHARRLRDPNEATPQMFSRVAKDLEGGGGGLVVGEWSAALNPGSLRGVGDEDAEKGAYVRAQLDLFEQHCAGWFFWTYKKQGGRDTGWSFRDAVSAGVFPPPSAFRRSRGSQPSKEELEAMKSRARDIAFGQHESYWNQYQGQYEHWRFLDGFDIGWDDALRFDTWSSSKTHAFADELGFRGPWLQRRMSEHVHEKGNGTVWEFQHGFSQGYNAASECLSKK